jgi:two-component system response regulator (stage 0 sporulation protein A)
MKKITKKILLECGIGAHLMGFGYLGEAVEMTVADKQALKHNTIKLYSEIAKKFGVRWHNVERSIRNAVESSFDLMTPEQIYAVYRNSIDYRRGKPSNSQFIATIAELYGDDIRAGE